MAKLVIEVPGAATFENPTTDEHLAATLLTIAEEFREGSGVWLTIGASELAPPHTRWIPNSASVVAYFDDPAQGTVVEPNLRWVE